MVFDLMPTDSDDDVAVLAQRMAAVPAALAGYRQSLELAADRGTGVRRPAGREVRGTVRHLPGNGDGTGFFTGLAGSVNPDGAVGPS